LYAHPYTKDIRLSHIALRVAPLSFTPLGLQEVFDLTVDYTNHYITGAGIVNRNCFDELPNFLEQQYRYLIGWNRTTKPGQRSRVVATGNPPQGPEGEWVIKYWAPWLDPTHQNPAAPGELRWFATIAGKENPSTMKTNSSARALARSFPHAFLIIPTLRQRVTALSYKDSPNPSDRNFYMAISQSPKPTTPGK
jgi:hypothetical protein